MLPQTPQKSKPESVLLAFFDPTGRPGRNLPRAARSFRTASQVLASMTRSVGSSRTSHSSFGRGLYVYFFVMGCFRHSPVRQKTFPMYRSLLSRCSIVLESQVARRGPGMRSPLNVSAMPWLPTPSRNIWKMRRTMAASDSRMMSFFRGCSGSWGFGSVMAVYPKHRPPVEKPAMARPSMPRMTFFRMSRTYIASMIPRNPQIISAFSSSDRTFPATSWTTTPFTLNSRKTNDCASMLSRERRDESSMTMCLKTAGFIFARARSWSSPGRSLPEPLMASSLRMRMFVSPSSWMYRRQFRTWSSMLRGS